MFIYTYRVQENALHVTTWDVYWPVFLSDWAELCESVKNTYELRLKRQDRGIDIYELEDTFGYQTRLWNLTSLSKKKKRGELI